MSKRDNFLLLEDMLEASRKIQRYCSGLSKTAFLHDDKTIDAVIRNFEIIGEAGNRVDADIQNLYSEIEWSKIRGFRNRLIHEYFGVDYDILWDVIIEDIAPLVDFLEDIVKE